jgi:hypothetical protein
MGADERLRRMHKFEGLCRQGTSLARITRASLRIYRDAPKGRPCERHKGRPLSRQERFCGVSREIQLCWDV